MHLKLRYFSLAAAAVLALLAGAPLAWSQDTVVRSGPLRFDERLIRAKYAYAYGIAAADVDGDGDLDLTSADARDNHLLWHANDGRGRMADHVVCEKVTLGNRLTIRDHAPP